MDTMFGNALPFIDKYVNELSVALSQIYPNGGLSRVQKKKSIPY